MGTKFVIKLLRDKSDSLSINAVVDVLISSIYGKGSAIERKQAVYKAGSLNRHLLFKTFRKAKKRRFGKNEDNDDIDEI